MSELDTLKGKRVAIMGGAGFIGHNMALKLKQHGAEPHVVDGLQVNNLGYYNSGYMNHHSGELYIAFINERLRLLRQHNIDLHVLDIRDYPLVCNTVNDIKPDAIVHLAAIAHANRSNKDPYSTFDHSMRTLENVLDNARLSGTHLIYFSSSMVYGNFDGEAVTEDRRCYPLGIYGSLKYGAEKLVNGYHQVFDMPYTIIRPSALYGERCVSRRVGQAFIENALMGKNLTINGDGKEGLDFTYVDDLVQGVMRAIVKPESRGEIFNLTYGEERSLNSLATIVQEHFPDVEITHNERDSLMPERGTLSIEKAKTLLGYKPEFPVEKGFVKYIEWYKEFYKDNKNLFQNN